MKRLNYIKPETKLHALHFEYQLMSQSPGTKTLDDDDDDDDWTPGAKEHDWDDDGFGIDDFSIQGRSNVFDY